MADITITVPNAVLSRVLDAIAARNGYIAAVHGTKAQFAKSLIIAWIKREVKGYEAGLASESAINTANASVDNDISIT
jgi:hypothetical protein